MPATRRQLAREQTMQDIVRIGREQLATVAPADLSLRAIARELGVVSSGIYRYVASRDELLTLLIVDAYDELGDAVDDALRSAPTRSRRRLQAVARAWREWGLAEPSRYALLFGSPVPGYAAPADRTTEPGTRVAGALISIVVDAAARGQLAQQRERLARPVRADMERIGRELGTDLPAPVLARGMLVWSSLQGLVSFDVFDHYGQDTLSDRSAFFEHQVDLLADLAGLE